MEVSKLRVTASEIGGGFGGKTHVWMEPIALALSRKAGRPVKLGDVARGSLPGFRADERNLDRRQDRRDERCRITAASAALRYSCGPYPAFGPSSGP